MYPLAILLVAMSPNLERLQEEWCRLKGTPADYGCQEYTATFEQRFPKLVQPTDRQIKENIQPWPSGAKPSIMPLEQWRQWKNRKFDI